jgi:hypothetical protein
MVIKFMFLGGIDEVGRNKQTDTSQRQMQRHHQVAAIQSMGEWVMICRLQA